MRLIDFGFRIEIDAEQEAILVLDEKIPRRVGLPAQLVDPSGYVHVEIGISIEQFAQHPQIIAQLPHVRANEDRLGMVFEQAFPLR